MKDVYFYIPDISIFFIYVNFFHFRQIGYMPFWIIFLKRTLLYMKDIFSNHSRSS